MYIREFLNFMCAYVQSKEIIDIRLYFDAHIAHGNALSFTVRAKN